MSRRGIQIRRIIAATLSVLVVPVGTLMTSASPSFASTGEPVGASEIVRVSASPSDLGAQALYGKLGSFRHEFTVDRSPAAARTLARVRSEVQAGAVTVHVPEGAGVAESASQVWVARSGERVAFVPYAGAVARPSGLTVVMNASGKTTRVTESVYQAISDTSGTATTWVNGKLAQHVLATADGTVENVATPTQVPGDLSWKKFKYCLTDIMAVPNWVLSIISVGCAALCAVTVPAVCLVCLVGLLVAYENEFIFCLGYAS